MPKINLTICDVLSFISKQCFVSYLSSYLYVYLVPVTGIFKDFDKCAISQKYSPREKGYSFSLDYFNAAAMVVTIWFIEQPLEEKRQK